MCMIKLNTRLTVGKVPEYNGKQYGKLSVSSQKLACKIEEKLPVIIFVLEENEMIIRESVDPDKKIAVIEWREK